MRTNNKFRILDVKKSDLVLDDDVSYIPPPDLNTDSSTSHLIYTLPWPLEKKVTFLLCLKYRVPLISGDPGSHPSSSRIDLTEDVFVLIFSYLRLPMYRHIKIH